jgi:UTP--glucose-1-phosphate uridylyltransferase
MIDIAYIRQKEALGLGHAALRAKELVGGEPFAVVLADDVIDAEVPCLKQLLDVYNFFNAPVLAVMEVSPENISAYGAIAAEPVHHNGTTGQVVRIRDLVEKPKASEAPSNLAIIGRYVLTPEIFDSSIRSPASTPARAARFSSPTRCATCCAADPSTPASFKVHGMTPATGWGS